jgi:hypothetical protein
MYGSEYENMSVANMLGIHLCSDTIFQLLLNYLPIDYPVLILHLCTKNIICDTYIYIFVQTCHYIGLHPCFELTIVCSECMY